MGLPFFATSLSLWYTNYMIFWKVPTYRVFYDPFEAQDPGEFEEEEIDADYFCSQEHARAFLEEFQAGAPDEGLGSPVEIALTDVKDQQAVMDDETLDCSYCHGPVVVRSRS